MIKYVCDVCGGEFDGKNKVYRVNKEQGQYVFTRSLKNTGNSAGYPRIEISVTIQGKPDIEDDCMRSFLHDLAHEMPVLIKRKEDK